MMYTHAELESVIDTASGDYCSLVIENQAMLRRIIQDICDMINGKDGDSVLSQGDKLLSFRDRAYLIDVFVPFELSRKTLMTKVIAALEQEAHAAEHLEDTSRILRDVELYLDRLAFGFPCDIIFPNVSVAAILKACAPVIRSDAIDPTDQVLDLMEIVREFDRDRLFFTLNMRSFVTDDEMERFVCTAVDHGYHIIGIESSARTMLSIERRVTVDCDLCEIF